MKRLSVLILWLSLFDLLSTATVSSQTVIDYSSVAWSPDGTMIALSGGGASQCGENPEAYAVTILDSQTRLVVHTLEHGGCRVETLKWSPDGTRIVGGNSDGHAYVWDVNTETLLLRTPSIRAFESRVGQVWSPDGHRIADFAWGERTLYIWDSSTGEVLHTIESAENIHSLSWKPNDERLAVGTWNAVLILDSDTGSVLSTFSVMSGDITAVDWSPDGTQLVTGSVDNQIRIWNVETGTVEKIISGHTESVYSVSWSPDGKFIATSDTSGVVQVWDANTGTPLDIFTSTDRIYSVDWSPDGTKLAYFDAPSNTLQIVTPTQQVTTPTETSSTSPNPDIVTRIAWSPDGAKIAIAAGSSGCDYENRKEYAVRIIDSTSMQAVQSLVGHSCRLVDVAWSPDGTKIASSGYTNSETYIWDLAVGEVVATGRFGTEIGVAVVWSPDGTKIASIGGGDNAFIWDATSGYVLFNLPEHDNYTTSVAWSPDGTKIATSSMDSTVKLWDLVTQKNTLTLSHTSPVYEVAWSPNSDQVASADSDGIISLWNARTGQLTDTITGHTDSVNIIEWSPDGMRLASGSSDGTVRIWDAVTGQEMEVIQGNIGPIVDLAWKPDGTALAYIGRDTGEQGGLPVLVDMPILETTPTATPAP